jgi:hypothetical protein
MRDQSSARAISSIYIPVLSATFQQAICLDDVFDADLDLLARSLRLRVTRSATPEGRFRTPGIRRPCPLRVAQRPRLIFYRWEESPPFLSSSLRGAGHNHAIRLDSRALRFRRHGFGRSDCTVEEESTLLPAWTYPAWRPGTPTRRSRAPACRPVRKARGFRVERNGPLALATRTWSTGATPLATHGENERCGGRVPDPGARRRFPLHRLPGEVGVSIGRAGLDATSTRVRPPVARRPPRCRPRERSRAHVVWGSVPKGDHLWIQPFR